jgi:hypothetical protein
MKGKSMSEAVQTLESLPSNAERVVLERVGNVQWEMRETKLDVHNEVALWSENPRLQTTAMQGFSSEIELEAALQESSGYAGLKKSIKELGQMQAIYVKRTATGKYLTLEGNTRVTALRDLDRSNPTGKLAGTFRQVDAKIVPANFDDRNIVALLAGIHVGGPGVRAWGRYIEARFVYETVVGRPGKPPVMNQSQLAASFGKSEAYVTRYKHAYEFALKFIEHISDDPNPPKHAADKFSILEEVSKARVIGAQLRDYDNPAYDDLRNEVFEMVRNNAFKEYRDARFLKEFHEDPDAWHQLKSGEEFIGNKLAKQVETKSSSPKAKIAGLAQSIRRAVERGEGGFDDEDISQLQQAIDVIEDQVHDGVHPYRLALKKATRTLNKASRADVIDLQQADINAFVEAHGYFVGLIEQHVKTGAE